MTSVRAPRVGVPILIALLCLAAVGCGRPHVKGTVAVDTILKSWQADGFDTASVLNIDPDTWSAGACSRGTITALDVLICEYSSDEALSAGEARIMTDWTASSIPTGVAIRTARTILALADPNQTDPSGRTIARLLKTFRELH